MKSFISFERSWRPDAVSIVFNNSSGQKVLFKTFSLKRTVRDDLNKAWRDAARKRKPKMNSDAQYVVFPDGSKTSGSPSQVKEAIVQYLSRRLEK